MNYQDAERFANWLLSRVVGEARGDGVLEQEIAPRGRFWLGRISPEAVVRNGRLGERGERLDPCAIGIRVMRESAKNRVVPCRGKVVVWRRVHREREGAVETIWRKSNDIQVTAELEVPAKPDSLTHAGQQEFQQAFASIGATSLSAEFQAQIEEGKQGLELIVSLVNTSPAPEKDDEIDAVLYEAALGIQPGETRPFVLDDLPDSFRYDRRVQAYGVNGGVAKEDDGWFVTTDAIVTERPRPTFWDESTVGPPPSLSFETLGRDPLDSLRGLVRAISQWGENHWSSKRLAQRAALEHWSPEMHALAEAEAAEFRAEVERLRHGLQVLLDRPEALRAFELMNRSFARAVALRHKQWRPFQIGFLLTCLPSLLSSADPLERNAVDTIWFPTGGGKTETYLAMVVTCAFADRLRGKRHGLSAWARFPLRMLSLQQTQRFADVLAAAEVVRQEEGLQGDGFSVGFLVGPGTPNRIPAQRESLSDVDVSDPEMPSRYRVLLRCPFCGSDRLEMSFDRVTWTLDHHCTNPLCSHRGAIPFRIVDDEIYRLLPTVVVGTLDKAANVGIQAAMRGLYGSPSGLCPSAGHGFTYAPRSKTPNGCLVPGCRARGGSLPQESGLFPPTLRIQDELHLLRDSLGAIDSHYESLLAHLESHHGQTAKLIASSATLAGYRQQVAVLYDRPGRVFPIPGPRAGESAWIKDSDRLARMYVGLAPRAVTLDYASDKANESLQLAIRWALDEPAKAAAAAHVDPGAIPDLALYYGVGVVYGSTLRDVEAAARSFQTQIPLDVNSVTLTGRTSLDEVRQILDRLTNPEKEFGARIHLVAASSMLSHGVDVDRLNFMVMLGIPLSTAEFIQTTSRVGRSWPGLVFVLHKIGRERDAKVFRAFSSFVQHGDRLVDPVPITRRSRNVLELTFPGIFMGRLYGVHEPAALSAGLPQLTTPARVRQAFARLPVLEADELKQFLELLGFTGPLDEAVRGDLAGDVRTAFRAINDPATTATFVSEMLPEPPMRSLRDVEDQVPVYSRGGHA